MRVIGILLFFAALCLPSLAFFTGWADRFAIDENRTLSPWPQNSLARDPVGYFAASEKWFDDRFGGRDFLIRLKTQIDYSLFGTSARVHIGKDDWLFYRSVLDVEKPRMERLLASDGDAIEGGIGRLAQKLKARNVHLVLLPVFLGDTFYPEKLPASVPKLPHPSRISQAVDRWHGIPDVTVMDSTSTLRTVQQQRPTFQKTDFHWNEPAGFEVAHELVKTVAAVQGINRDVWDHRLDIETNTYSGKEATFLPLFAVPTETGLFVKPTWSEPGLSYAGNQGIYEWVSTQVDSDRAALPAMCVVGDSFFDGLTASGFPTYFRKIYFLRWHSEFSLDPMLEHMPEDCRYLLLEFIETQFPAISSLKHAAEKLKP